jgi:hypothetical protein
MDEITFNRFVDYVITHRSYIDNYQTIDVRALINELYQLRENTENHKNFKDAPDEKRTILFNYVPTACWFPGCFLLDVLILIFLIIVMNEMYEQTMLVSICVCPLLR